MLKFEFCWGLNICLVFIIWLLEIFYFVKKFNIEIFWVMIYERKIVYVRCFFFKYSLLIRVYWMGKWVIDNIFLNLNKYSS